YLDDVDAIFRQNAMMFGIMALIVFAVVLLASIIISRSVAKPLHVITDLTGRLAAGDQAFEVPYTTRKDEIGGLAKALSVFKDNAGAMARMHDEQAELKRRGEAGERRPTDGIARKIEARGHARG